MKYIEHDETVGKPVLELTRRNLETLLAKLADPLSSKMIADPDIHLWVRAVPDEEHYADRPPGLVYMPTERRYI